MNRWEYLRLTYMWNTTDTWLYMVTEPWLSTYAELLRECAEVGADEGPLWMRLGADGWELVAHNERQRDNPRDATLMNAGVYTFRRPLDEPASPPA
jgi:hypothetical protein